MILKQGIQNTLCDVADSYLGKVLSELSDNNPILFIAKDARYAQQIRDSIPFYDKNIDVLEFPAWDCLPYDRTGPRPDISAMRCATLAKLLTDYDNKKYPKKRIVITTAASVIQKVVPRHILKNRVFKASIGDEFPIQKLIHFLVENGFQRTETVRETGEYAVRGGIVDIYPSGQKNPIRLDFFGDELEKIKIFDAASQQSTSSQDTFSLYPAGEVLLTEETIANFKKNYREKFGGRAITDTLFHSIENNVQHQGYEHWTPLFYNSLETLFQYMPLSTQIIVSDDALQAYKNKATDIKDYYLARHSIAENAPDSNNTYRPLDPQEMYITEEKLNSNFINRTVVWHTIFSEPESETVQSYNIKPVKDFTNIRVKKSSVIKELKNRMAEENRPIAIACDTLGSSHHIMSMLHNEDIKTTEFFEFSEISKIKGVGICVIPFEHGFSSDDVIFYTERDLFGEKIRTAKKQSKRAENFLTEASTLDIDDLVVHINSGIGRYKGLETISVGTFQQDCLKIEYDEKSFLYVPVENIDTLSRYGADNVNVKLDRLGGKAWQIKKAKLKERIGIMAEKLIEIAASRSLKHADKMPKPIGIYDEFVARFPYTETDDQDRAIEEVLHDLIKGSPMDRLVCGDVGFGKTEVALRAAFIAAVNGYQVAIAAPTTLLARQHYKTFTTRFDGFPLKVAQLSRLVSPKEAKLIKDALYKGDINIIIGTHALFAKSTTFNNLGLLIIDEEQHFGVAQKESLKALKNNVHVLSLSATPIPRTLQMSLAGVRDLSIIATPPIDRLAVRTFILPYDGIVIKEAILREKFRGGQVYYVCPRISDIEEVFKRLKILVPELRIAIAHGGLNPTELDSIMTDFTDGLYDILLATNIIESGIDIATANTMIVHRSDMFGLGQLYQLRGRIGRSKTRAYCYLTSKQGHPLNPVAKKRLNIMQTLDTLGAGFQVASHDMDLRGAGNLLGDEQSGHIKEVGVELYQKMLEDEIRKRKDTNSDTDTPTETYSPNIKIELTALIPQDYMQDSYQRLNFYRRLGTITSEQEKDTITLEIIDRFGPPPQELKNLLDISMIKISCLAAGVEKIEATTKGVTVWFHNNTFSNPIGLLKFIQESMGTIKLHPDHSLQISRSWSDTDKKIKGILSILEKIKTLKTTV